MKKNLNYLLIILLAFAINISLVNAEQAGDTDANVIVGQVDQTGYSVDVYWQNLVFDWKYDGSTNQYKWVNREGCSAVDNIDELPGRDFEEKESYSQNGTFYYDSSCDSTINDQTYINEMLESKGQYIYYIVQSGASIYIEDKSTNGYITPSFTWSPETKYDFTTASFKYFEDGHEGDDGTGIAFTGELPYSASYASPVAPGIRVYDVLMNLGVDSSKTINTPTTGEKIGTLTITIATH